MRRFVLMLTALLVSACTLSNQPATPTLLPTTPAVTETAAPSASVTPLPAIESTAGATRTPFGNNAPPTVQTIGTPGAFPTLASGESAEITSPANGTAVSGSPLYVSGVVHHLPEDQFTLQVFDPSGQPLTSGQTITLSNPNHVADVPWSASLMVGSYSGAAQIRIIARIADGTDAVVGAADVTITPGSAANTNPVQPSDGSAVVGILSPANGSSASGDPISVTGTAGGITDNQFTLMLLDSRGTVLNSQLITLTGAENNVVPWSASLGTSGYHGSAEIRAVIIQNGQQVTMASVTITLQ